MSNQSVYVIYSKWCLADIRKFLLQTANAPSDVYLKIERHAGRETNRTLALLPSSVATKLLAEGFGEKSEVDFYLVPYTVRSHNLPREDETQDLYLPLPEWLTGSEVKESLLGRLGHFESFNIISLAKTIVKVPLKSRNGDIHRGAAFITFSDTNLDNIAIVKALLHGSYWDGDNNKLVQCFWSKAAKPVKAAKAVKAAKPVKSKDGFVKVVSKRR